MTVTPSIMRVMAAMAWAGMIVNALVVKMVTLG